MAPADSPKEGFSSSKVVIMMFLIMVDLGLNSSIDYDSYNNMTAHKRSFLAGMLSLNLIVEISIFLVLFLAMANTFLFRVGLLGFLIKKFRTTLFFHPLYIGFTIATGFYRYDRIINGSDSLTDLWHDSTFIALSLMQKTVAIPYYLFNLRAAMKLSSKIYFEKRPWVCLIQQNMKLNNHKHESNY